MSQELESLLSIYHGEIAKFIKGHEVIKARLRERSSDLIIISRAPCINCDYSKANYQITRAFISGTENHGIKIAVNIEYYGNEMQAALTELLRVA